MFGNSKVYDPFYVGYDKLFRRLEDFSKIKSLSLNNYPPYNVIRDDEVNFTIEMAVAGFGKEDITVELVDSKLVISGSIPKSKEVNYTWKGISTRSFTRSFELADTVEIRSAELHGGILTIKLENVIAEGKLPKKIPINERTTSERQFLSE